MHYMYVQPTRSLPTLNWHELTKSDFVIPCLNFKPWNERVSKRKREYNEKLMSGRQRLESMCANYVEFSSYFQPQISYSVFQLFKLYRSSSTDHLAVHSSPSISLMKLSSIKFQVWFYQNAQENSLNLSFVFIPSTSPFIFISVYLCCHMLLLAIC